MSLLNGTGVPCIHCVTLHGLLEPTRFILTNTMGSMSLRAKFIAMDDFTPAIEKQLENLASQVVGRL
jgi:hypothetical protein